MTDKITTHVPDAKARLIQQYNDKPKIEGMLKALYSSGIESIGAQSIQTAGWKSDDSPLPDNRRCLANGFRCRAIGIYFYYG